MSIYRVTLFVCSLFVLGGCATAPSNVSTAPYKKPSSISEIGDYTASGKILLVNGKDKQSGYFYWRRSDKGYQFVVSTILGIDVFSLKVDQNFAKVYIDGKEHSGSDPQALLYTLTGQTLPLNQISNWLIGQVDSNKVLNLTKLPNGLPERFIFKPSESSTPMPIGSSWSVHYQKYDTTESLKLPSQIQISSSHNRIKLKINNWDLY